MPVPWDSGGLPILGRVAYCRFVLIKGIRSSFGTIFVFPRADRSCRLFLGAACDGDVPPRENPFGTGQVKPIVPTISCLGRILQACLPARPVRQKRGYDEIAFLFFTCLSIILLNVHFNLCLVIILKTYFREFYFLHP